jgi:alcohol dehydrogenase, propanol-preferring
MKAQVLQKPAPIETGPLQLTDVPAPIPPAGHILVEVSVCAVCHTDLHVVEGELPGSILPVIPGHQVVGKIAAVSSQIAKFQPGQRVGIPWLHETCGSCEYCLRGQENLCEAARFTGYTAQGGYAEFITVPESFAFLLPDSYSDIDAAPLLCAGIVGYRSVKLSGLLPGERVGLYGFGASAHICLQIARYWNCEVSVFTRSTQHQQRALELGAFWAGQAQDEPPRQLDRAIIFAPAGWIVPLALQHLRKGGTLCINAIHMSSIPEMPYSLLWHERTLCTVANATRRDAEEFLPLAAQIPIRTETQVFDLSEGNRALNLLKHSEISGAAVLRVH